MNTLKLTSHLLIFTMLTTPLVRTAAAAEVAEKAKFSAEQILAMKQNLSDTTTNEEILGGKIVNKDNPSEAIAAECVESDTQGSCTSVQYIMKKGFAKKTLTAAVPMAALIDLNTKIKAEVKKALDAYLQSNMREPIEIDLAAITGAIADDANANDGDSIWAVSALVGALAAIVGGTIVGLLVTNPMGWAVFGITAVTGATWPVLTDIVIMPAKLAAAGISRLLTSLHNAKVRRKTRKALKHIQAALDVTLENGNKTVNLSQENFTALLSVLDHSSDGASSSAPNTEIK